MRSFRFGLCSLRIFVLSFTSFFIRIAAKGQVIIIFPVFHFHSLTSIHLVYWDFYHFFFDRSICIPDWKLIKLVLLGDLHFTCIFIDAVKLQLLTFISKWHCEDLSSYQTITLLLQSERLNKVRLAPVFTTIYLSHLPNPTPTTYHLFVYQNI